MDGTTSLLVIDDDPLERRLVRAIFESAGAYTIDEAATAEDGIARVTAAPPDVVLLDVRLPGMNGLDALERIKAQAPATPVLMLTADHEIQTAVEATRRGAHQFLTKPIRADELVVAVRRAIERRDLDAEVEGLRRTVQRGGALAALSSASPTMRAVVGRIRQVAGTRMTVLIQGETGTGKELVARAIHQESGRAGPLVAVDCGALPETLLESELFGHEKGAFTGADRRREGLVEAAAGGTLFLDEAGNLPAATQAKLLRVLQERQVLPVGATRPRAIDVRVVAASHCALAAEARAGRFREDLYYRLSEFTIMLPPLRERADDILPLAAAFRQEASLELRRPVSAIAEDAGRLLAAHAWPGNVRELRNVIREAVLLADDHAIRAAHVRPLLRAERTTPAPVAVPIATGRSLREIAESAAAAAEKQAIVQALKETAGNKTRAARLLKVDYKTLYTKLKRHGLQSDVDSDAD